jgi:kynurenine aminotransferase
MIIVNTPHNPVGKVFTRTELEKIAALAEEFNLLVMADEVVRLELSCVSWVIPQRHLLPVRLPGLRQQGTYSHRHTSRDVGAYCHCWIRRKRVSSLPPREYFLTSRLESFAATGWRVGWLIGPPSILNPTLAASTRIVFCTNSPLQEAAAAGLEQAAERQFFETQLKEYQERRDVFVSVFDRLAVTYTLPEGTYFVLMVRP